MCLSAGLRAGRPGLAEVQRTLPPGTALVAYVKYWDPLRSPRSPAAFYLAFLLPAGNGGPAVVSLGGAESIEAAIRGWQKEAAADPRLAPGR